MTHDYPRTRTHMRLEAPAASDVRAVSDWLSDGCRQCG
jgi:hypothetical protein